MTLDITTITENEQKSILKIFIGFTFISLITFFIITSIYINQNFIHAIYDIENNSHETQLNFIARNVERYVGNRVQIMQDVSTNQVIKSFYEGKEINPRLVESFFDNTLILGDKAAIALLDTAGNELISSQKLIVNKFDQNSLNKILRQEKIYGINILTLDDKEIMQIAVPVFYQSSIRGILLLESEIDYTRIFGIHDPKNISFGFQSSGKTFYEENYQKIKGNEFQKYIPDLNLVVYYKVGNKFFRSTTQKLIIDLFLSILISAIISTGILFLLGKNMLLEPHIELAKNKLLLLKRTKDLEQSNEELDRFAYIISHDLKEPLRGMAIYAGMVLKSNKEKLNNESIEKLENIIELSKKSATMLNSILDCSRVGKVELAYQDTNIQDLVNEVIFTLEAFLKENNAKVIINNILPTLKCDSVRTGEVFKNLITNGIKYNDKAEKIIEIGSKVKDGLRYFYVKDNGIGIEKKHFSTIFEIFKRINQDDKGTGVGLSLVKKIIERHNGQIEIESTVGEGTTFTFHLGQ